LKGAGDQAPEPEVRLFTEGELACTATGQVATSLGCETVFSMYKKRADLLSQRLPPPSSPAELVSFKEKIRQRVRQLTRFEPSKGALTMKPYGEITRSGYRIKKLIYESEPGITVPSLLYVPETAEARKPAILYVHRRGKAAAGADSEEWVKRGFVVLAIDMRGTGETQFGETQQGSDYPRYFGDFDSAMTALLIGKPLVGMRAQDVSRGVDLLTAQPDVDPDRIYAYGREEGGVPLLYAAVLDERIKKIAIEGTLVSYQSVITNRIHRQVLESTVRGALKDYDLPDLVAALAPRSAFIVNGVNALGHRVAPGEITKQYATASTAFLTAGNKASLRIAERREDERAAAFYSDFFSIMR
jgi:dienelactone hydrolase